MMQSDEKGAYLGPVGNDQERGGQGSGNAADGSLGPFQRGHDGQSRALLLLAGPYHHILHWASHTQSAPDLGTCVVPSALHGRKSSFLGHWRQRLLC